LDRLLPKRNGFNWEGSCSSYYTNWYPPSYPQNVNNVNDYVALSYSVDGKWFNIIESGNSNVFCGCEYSVGPSVLPTTAPSSPTVLPTISPTTQPSVVPTIQATRSPYYYSDSGSSSGSSSGDSSASTIIIIIVVICCVCGGGAAGAKKLVLVGYAPVYAYVDD